MSGFLEAHIHVEIVLDYGKLPLTCAPSPPLLVTWIFNF